MALNGIREDAMERRSLAPVSDRPRISVILPAYNVGNHLAACLEGLRDQNYPLADFEVILVDNNSTDRTVEIAQRFDVRVLHETKQGSYAARNSALAHARGGIIAFLDPDCRPHRQWLSAIEQGMSDPHVQVLLGRRQYGDGSLPLDLLAGYEAEKIQWILANDAREQVFGYTNNMAVRDSLIEQFGPFEERTRGADTRFVRQVADALGCSVIRYAAQMTVDHLEVASVRDYYRKRAVYGESNERLSKSILFRPLAHHERWKVLRAVLRRRRPRFWHAVLLLGLLIPGAIIYDRARNRAR